MLFLFCQNIVQLGDIVEIFRISLIIVAELQKILVVERS